MPWLTPCSHITWRYAEFPYAFFVVFAVVKITALNSMMQADGVSLAIALQSVWDEKSQALFAAVMSFWFGSRPISKMRWGG